jgi:hypothetical protein
VARARSTRRHHATLLHYVAANGVEGGRQRTPPNAVEIAKILLDAGAEADALADMYEHPCTTLVMLVSSAHPHVAGVQVALVDTLVDFGAAVDGVDGDSAPLMTALAFHYLDAAEELVQRGARVDNLPAAAALGRADLVDRFMRDDGSLRPGVARPLGPWPRLSTDPTEHVRHALTWAATWGRTAVVELMLRKGASAAAQDNDAGAIHFAAAHGHMDVVRLLLEHGASLEARNSYGGTVLSGTLWYAFNTPMPGIDYAEVVRALLALGARADVYPAMQSRLAAVLAGKWGADPDG